VLAAENLHNTGREQSQQETDAGTSMPSGALPGPVIHYVRNVYGAAN
jgi:hypothetical protein